MRVFYDRDTDSLRVVISDRPAVERKEVATGVVAGFDESGVVVSLDIKDASERVERAEAAHNTVAAD